MAKAKEICDFCSSPNPRWAYPAADFAMPRDGLGPGEDAGFSSGAWAACDPCHELIEQGNYSKLADRSARQYIRNHPNVRLTKAQKKVARDQFHKLHLAFRAHRQGEAVPNDEYNEKMGQRVWSRVEDEAKAVYQSPEAVDLNNPDDLSSVIKEVMGIERSRSAFNFIQLPPRPLWANARSFNPVWDSLLRDQPRSSDVAAGITPTPGMYVSSVAFQALIDAHLVVVEPDQVMAIEDQPVPEMWRYGQRVNVPWTGGMYMDFEGYGKQHAEVECSLGTAELFGAIVFHPSNIDWSSGVPTNPPHLAIAPIGGTRYLREHVGWGIGPDAKPIMARLDRPDISWWDYVCMGVVYLGGQDISDPNKPLFTVQVPQLESLHVSHITPSPEGLGQLIRSDEWKERQLHAGAVMTSTDVSELTKFDVGKFQTAKEEFERQTFLHAEMLTRMAAKTLQTIYFMENAPVTVEREQVSRQVRRNAERQGAKIGDIVLIRNNRHKEHKPADESSHVDYSHRWWRKGYVMHLKAEKYLRNRPDKVTPCDRIGKDRCPNGECIKVWVEPVICGPEDKPLVVKSHHLKGEK